MPTPHETQKLIDQLYLIVNQLRQKIQEAKETAVYAETLSVDLWREAEHELFVYEERLAYTLMMIDTVWWATGRSTSRNHVQEFSELMQAHYKQISNL